MSDTIRQTQLPARGETDLDSIDSVSDTMADDQSTSNDEKMYQADFDYQDDDRDLIIDEETDNPADELGIPEAEFRDELDKYASGDSGEGDDDMREDIEDHDEDDDNAASTA